MFNNFLLSHAISCVVLILTIAATIYTKYSLESHAEHEFTIVCNEIKNKIHSRLHTQSVLLQSCSSFISASDTVTSDDWKFFIKNSKIFQNMFGYQGLAYNTIIHKAQTANYEEVPKDEKNTYTSIIYIEPHSKENLKAIGYDTYSEPVRRKAMEFARDFNLSALTDKLTLVQENQTDKQAGIIMYTPVYRKNTPLNNVKDRRNAIMGWVSCPYRMEGLMMNILGPWGLDNPNKKKIHLVIYDNDTISQTSILFDSRKNSPAVQDTISVQIRINPLLFNEKNWTLQFSQSKEQYSYFRGKVLIVLLSGLAISLLSFLLTVRLYKTHRNMQKRF